MNLCIMYIMKWTVAQARESFADLLQSAQQEPQSIFNRDRFVAAVIDAETFAAFQAWQVCLPKTFCGTSSASSPLFLSFS
jgi:hypothetical protein